MMKTAAISEETKNATLSQEVIRRLMTTRGDEPDDAKKNILDNFTRKLSISGYEEV